MAYLAYLLHTKPFISSTDNNIEIFNEGCFYVATLALLHFTDFEESIDHREKMGWLTIMMMVLNFLVNWIRLMLNLA